MKDITLHAKWLIKAPLIDVFNIMTDFEKFPEYFPKVAESIKIMKREENILEMDAIVKSFGQKFPVKMKTQILSGKGYIYQVTIHKRWLRLIARPLIGWFSMKYWKKAVIDELRKRLER